MNAENEKPDPTPADEPPVTSPDAPAAPAPDAPPVTSPDAPDPPVPTTVDAPVITETEPPVAAAIAPRAKEKYEELEFRLEEIGDIVGEWNQQTTQEEFRILLNDIGDIALLEGADPQPKPDASAQLEVTIVCESILKGQKCKVVEVLEDGRLSVEVLADVKDAEGNVAIAKGERTTVAPGGCE